MNARVVVGSVAAIGTALAVGVPTAQKMMVGEKGAVVAPGENAMPSPIGLNPSGNSPRIGMGSGSQLPATGTNPPAAPGTSDWPKNEPPVVDLGALNGPKVTDTPDFGEVSDPNTEPARTPITTRGFNFNSNTSEGAATALPSAAPRITAEAMPSAVRKFEPLEAAPMVDVGPIGVLPPELAPGAAASLPESHAMSEPPPMAAVAAPPEDISIAREIPSENPAAVRRAGEDFERVKVFYGTDRKVATKKKQASGFDASQFGITLALLVVAVVFFVASLLVSYRKTLRVLSVVTGVGAVGCGVMAFLAGIDSGSTVAGTIYGNDRGELVTGVCEISIPSAVHSEGEVERPSLLRLQIRQDPLKHVVLQSTDPVAHDEFYDRIRQRVASSPRKDVFVFVHGFNVSFEDAARRTAQIAYDLRFEGAPVFYSWPSQAGLLQYTVDETNVEWTVPHLRQFLMKIANHSGADSVNLVAHSMGNRALTNALKGLSYRLKGEKLFREVVLTAPDIDAEIFKRDIAPAIVKTANRVTLYASSNDEALLLSKKIHGAPRAGDSGSDLMVIPGIETIDVSQVDTSLLGHSYYGSNQSVLSDMSSLLRNAPTEDRRWLGLMSRGGMSYWVFVGNETAAARSGFPH